MTEESLLQFPCEFPIKVMGRAGPEFEGTVMGIVHRHFPKAGNGAVATRPSSGGNYTALTITVTAESKAQLDALYRELTACDKVSVVL